MTNCEQPYTGRELLISAQQIPGIRGFIHLSLRRSSPYRAMSLPILAGLVLTILARYTLQLGIDGTIAPELSFVLGIVVLWPAALATAVGADLIKKEHKFQSGVIG